MNRKYIVAVSGGIDSVVLLHQLWKLHPAQLIVAHFDHGIRDNSADDASFVQQLAEKYKLPYEGVREELGGDASEEVSRERRYLFLRRIADTYGGVIVTAHHSDDVVETIAINLQRGTGWRGLAVLDSVEIMRPLIRFTKQQLRDYAGRHNLEWREDSTNQSDAYLRNRLRQKIATEIDDDTSLQLQALRDTQRHLKQLIDAEASEILQGDARYSRYFFSSIDEVTASELLRHACINQYGVSPHRPQRSRALLAIKTINDGKTYQMGDGFSLQFTKRHFSIQHI